MSEYYFHLDHLTVGYDKKPLIKDTVSYTHLTLPTKLEV